MTARQPKFSWNIDGGNGAAVDIARQFLPQYRPTLALIMGNVSFALEMLDATEKQTLIIHREYKGDDYENVWWNWRAQDWKNLYQKGINDFGPRYKELVHQFLNEPKFSRDGVGSREQARRYIEFVTEVADWARDNGIRLAIPIPNAEVTYERIWDGEFDELIRRYDAHGWRQAGHIWFLHEYTWLHTFNGMACGRPVKDHPKGFGPDIYKRADILRDTSQWATKQDVEQFWPSNFTAFRGMYFIKRQIYLGYQPGKVAVLEAPWDDTPHLHHWNGRNIYNEVIQHYGLPPQPLPFASYRGVMALEPAYAKMFPEDMMLPHGFEELLFAQLVHLHEVAPDYYIGMCWFMLDPGDHEWGRPQPGKKGPSFGCSFHGLTWLHQRCLRWAQQLRQDQSEPEEPPMNLKSYTIYKPGVSNMHLKAGLSNLLPTLITIPSGAQVLADPNAHLDWAWVEYGGHKGWLPKQMGLVEFRTPEPQPEPGTPPALPALSDPRWTAAKAAPMGSSTNIRAVTSTISNTPIGTLPSGINDIHIIPDSAKTAAEAAYTKPDQHRWYIVKVPQASGAEVVGYIREDAADVRFLEAGQGLLRAIAVSKAAITRLSALRSEIDAEINAQQAAVAEYESGL